MSQKLHLGDLKDDWEGTAAPISHNWPVTSTFGTYLSRSGDFRPTLYLAESYDVPYQECFFGNNAANNSEESMCDITDERKTTLYNFGEGHAHAARLALAAGHEARALRQGVGRVLLDLRECLRIDQRTLVGGAFQAIAHAQLLHRHREPRREVVVDASLH